MVLRMVLRSTAFSFFVLIVTSGLYKLHQTHLQCRIPLTVNLERIVHLNISGRMLTEHRQQIQKILKRQIPGAVTRERLADALFERVLAQLVQLLDVLARNAHVAAGRRVAHPLRHQVRPDGAVVLVHAQNLLAREERAVLVVLQLLVGERHHFVAHCAKSFASGSVVFIGQRSVPN